MKNVANLTHPKKIMIEALYFTTKVENNNITSGY